jgi:outer membrane protein OmpA-like peptidoglycan-associated protein
MRLRTILLTATLLTAPFAVRAQPISGVYIGVGAGVNFMQDERLRSTTIGGANFDLGKTRARFDTGYRALASVGYGLGNGLRVEVEGDYFRNSLSRIGRNSSGSVFNNSFQTLPVTARGDEEKWGGFVNAIFDVDTSRYGLGALPFAITPYLGAGVGYLQTHNQDVRIASPGQFLIRSTGTDGNFAYQGIVGLALPISAVPGLAFTAEYRFTGIAGNRDLKGQFFSPGVATRARLRESDDFNHSLVAVAVRYAFNYPPPPSPVPVAVPTTEVAPQRTYLVFFDWDRADLTARARQIVAEAAASSTRVQTTRIEVQGNADRSGTPAYNQGLSLRRARAVAAELVRNGVPQAGITVQGFGDTRPLVPTQAGVREPQNRRVEIILR